MSVFYHPGKENLVEDALSRLSMGSLSYVEESKRYLVKDVHRLASLGVQTEDSPIGGVMVHHTFELSLVVEVEFKQHLDQTMMELTELVLNKHNELFSLEDGVLR